MATHDRTGRTEVDTLGMLVVGGGLAAAGALAWGAAQPFVAPSIALDATWIYPVPSLGDRHAVVSNPFAADTHLGVDVMFRRRDARDLIAVYPPRSTNGSKLFFMPDDVPALAASAGTVTFAGMTPVGNTVIVQHPNGWTTYYTHLATLAVSKAQAVTAGEVLGTIGASPKDPAHLAHLHFELWKGRKRSTAVDPGPYLAAWARVTAAWAAPSSLVTPATLSLRNGSLSAYRPVGDRGEPYPAWVRRLRGESGVYVIREIDGPIVYVGSSVGRLYETLTRHFQTWRRYKGFWRGQFAEGADPGLTYARSEVEVAIKTTAPDGAHEEELRTIRRLQPRDNQLGQPDSEPELEDAPF